MSDDVLLRRSPQTLREATDKLLRDVVAGDDWAPTPAQAGAALDLLSDAADEIERLTAEVERLKRPIGVHDTTFYDEPETMIHNAKIDTVYQENRALEAEVERLKEIKKTLSLQAAGLLTRLRPDKHWPDYSVEWVAGWQVGYGEGEMSTVDEEE